MSVQVTGKMKVWKNKAGFTTSVGNKLESGEYENMFVPLSFKGGPSDDMEHGDTIDVQEGFLTFFTTKKEEQVPKIVVMKYSFDVDETTKPKKPSKPKK